MSVYLESNFCSSEHGLDYIFAKMGAIYGASFTRHFEGVDPNIVRDTWKEVLGVYATHKPHMDFALKNMDKTFPPSAIAFYELCQQAGRIPIKPEKTITHQKLESQKIADQIAKEEALKKIREFTKGFGK